MQDGSLQLKKDELWELYQAQQRVASLKREITSQLKQASQAITGWDEKGLRMSQDGAIVANYHDGSLTSGIEFGGSDVLAANLRKLGKAQQALASARNKFDSIARGHGQGHALD